MKRTLALNEHTMQALKKLEWEGVDSNRFCAAIDNELFLELTGLNADFISSLITKSCYCEVSYWREELEWDSKDVVGYSYYLSVYYSVDDYVAFNCDTEESVNDFMELFIRKQQEKTDNEILLDAINDYLKKGHCHNDIFELLKSDFKQLYDTLRDHTINNLTYDDYDNLPSSLQQECVWNYIDENPAECLDRAAEKCYEEDVKHFIINYLKNKL